MQNAEKSPLYLNLYGICGIINVTSFEHKIKRGISMKKIIAAILSLTIALSCAITPVTSYALSDTETTIISHNPSTYANFNISATLDYEQAYKVLDKVNEQRAANGLSKLTMDKDLLDTAMFRACETSVFWGHDRPDGSSCFTASTKMWGENIAMGYVDADKVMNGWMNSEGHRNNILGANFKSIGIGCVTVNGGIFWVQCFGRNDANPVANKSDTPNTKQTIESITAKRSSTEFYLDLPAHLSVGGEAQIKCGVVNSKVQAKTPIDPTSITYESSDSSVLTISQDGKVKALSSGTATVKIYLGGETYPSMEKEVTVGGSDIALADVTFSGSREYTGKAIQPTVTVKYSGKTLAQGKDYTVTFSNNTNAGTANAVIAGIGEYSGNAEKTFTITQMPVSKLAMTLSTKEYTYDGSEKKPAVKVTNNGTELKKGTDYTLTYSSNVKPGTAVVKVVGKGNYSGTAALSYTIKPKSLAACTATLSTTSYTYSGTAKKPAVTVKSGSQTLKNGTDYTVTYSANTAAGTGKVTIKGKGIYGGTLTKTFKINKASLSKATITGISSKSFTGKALTQSPVIKLGGYTLVKDKDYTLKYSNNKNVGKATVTITGKGSVTGTITKTFNINPAKQELQKLTAKSKGFFADWVKKGSATGYEIQYATNSKFTGAKTIKLTTNKNDTKTATKLKAKTKYYVRVRSYTNVKGVKYNGAWSAVKTVTTLK